MSSETDADTARNPTPAVRDQVVSVAQREFTTLVRTRTYAALALAFGLFVVALPVLGGIGGYLPLVLDLLTPVEVLVPLLAFGFGAWTFLADAERGELEVVRTYPVTRTTYVAGAYLGRAVGLLAALIVPLAVAGVLTPFLRDPTTSVVAVHGTVDSPAFFLRFLVIAAVYALVTLALAMAVSAAAQTRTQGVALAVLAVLVVVLGLDFLVVAGVAGGILGEGSLAVVLGFTPPGAFRGLVLATAAGGLVESGPPAASILASVVGLALWFVAALAAATFAVWTPQRHQ